MIIQYIKKEYVKELVKKGVEKKQAKENVKNILQFLATHICEENVFDYNKTLLMVSEKAGLTTVDELVEVIKLNK